MASNKKSAPNIDNSDPTNFPYGRIRDNSGSGDGTPVNRLLYGDLHEFFGRIMGLADINYNELPDCVDNGYQLVDAAAALAGKNDLVFALNTVNMVISGVATDVITIATKLNILKLNEVMFCKAAVDYNAEVKIKGSTTAIYTAAVPSPYKAGDYISLVKTDTGFSLIRLADALNLDVLAAEYNYLKAATNDQENEGTATTVATTPASNKQAFVRRVNGADSGTYLASLTQNGLLSKEDKEIIDSFVSPVKNIGWFSGLDIGLASQVNTNLPISGDTSNATVTAVVNNDASRVRVTLVNAMDNTNYFVRTMIQSEGTIGADDDIMGAVFKPIDTTHFDFQIATVTASTNPQSIKVHFEVVQVS
jgi:hypothetical protein